MKPNQTMDSNIYTEFTREDRDEMREWIREKYRLGRGDISDYMVIAFLKMKNNKQNLHLWKG